MKERQLDLHFEIASVRQPTPEIPDLLSQEARQRAQVIAKRIYAEEEAGIRSIRDADRLSAKDMEIRINV